MTVVYTSAHVKRRTPPSCIRSAVWCLCGNQTHKHTVQNEYPPPPPLILDHILNTAAECQGVGVMGWGDWAAWHFPRMLMLQSYESLLLLGFSEDRFPLSLLEELNHGIWKSHDATVRVFILCVKSRMEEEGENAGAGPSFQSKRGTFEIIVKARSYNNSRLDQSSELDWSPPDPPQSGSWRTVIFDS